ncbi:MAG: GntR family transcriptional regulator [Bacteroidales bacterium]|nr:GntR family transcriptional regulator [Bacteroidales bacterium]
MAIIGQINSLKIVKKVDFGVYLDGGEHGEILMPKRYVPATCETDQLIDVFLYKDSDDRLIATTEIPFVKINECAVLEVVAVNTAGAFLNWGLPKDLLVPYREQTHKMETGKRYLVYVYLDKETNRIVASEKIDKFLDNTPPVYEVGQEVALIVYHKTDLGYKAIINHRHTGILYLNEVFQPLQNGQNLTGYIKKVRDDDKIDLSLHKPGQGKSNEASSVILAKLKENNGFLPYCDKSIADEIYQVFGMSKKTFKMVIGNLYRKGAIVITENGIKLAK